MVRKITFILSALLLMAVGASAQVTTSALSGLVTDENDHPMIGASVQALHVPSGTSYNAVSNLDGRFTIQGMRTGGPYTVQVSFVGYAPQTFEGIRLQLGNTYSLAMGITAKRNTKIPIPPIQWEKLLQKRVAWVIASTSVKIVAPVVVKPELISNTASM